MSGHRTAEQAATPSLPELFDVVMPDDTLAPNIPRGMRLTFRRADSARPGEGVLVQAGDGRRYIRRYEEGPGGAWLAQAINPTCAGFESVRDELVLLAVLSVKHTGEV